MADAKGSPMQCNDWKSGAVCGLYQFLIAGVIHDHPAIEIRFNQSRISANFNDRAELPPSAFPSLLHPQTSFTNSVREAAA